MSGGDQIGDSEVLWEVLEDSFWIVTSGLDDPDVAGLSESQRDLASLLFVWTGIESGGFSEPMVNSGGDWLPAARRAAVRIGANELATKLGSLISFLGCTEAEFADRAIRQRLADSIPDEGWRTLDTNTDPFLDWYRKAEEYVRQNPNEF